LREYADVWPSQLRMHLHSPDPHDRILALQVVNTRALAHQFRDAIEPLVADSVQAIRRLSESLLRSMEQQPIDDERTHERRAHEDEPRAETHEQLRQQLSEALERLAAGTGDPTDTHMISQVRELLREVYADVCEAAPRGTASEEMS